MTDPDLGPVAAVTLENAPRGSGCGLCVGSEPQLVPRPPEPPALVPPVLSPLALPQLPPLRGLRLVPTAAPQRSVTTTTVPAAVMLIVTPTQSATLAQVHVL